jgi:hypothetical protein
LQFAGPDVQPHFFHIARRRDIKHSDVWGPAGAFAYNLARLNWSITSDGLLLTDSNLELHLLHSSQSDIFRQLERSW